jgi:hypothetical protein
MLQRIGLPCASISASGITLDKDRAWSHAAFYHTERWFPTPWYGRLHIKLRSSPRKALNTFLPTFELERCRSDTAFGDLNHPINNLDINTLLHEPPAASRPLLLVRRNEVKPLHKRRHKLRHLEQRDVLADTGSRAGSELLYESATWASLRGI